MKSNAREGINSRYFKTLWVVLLIFALVIPYMSGIRIPVHAADAEVWKIYANVSGDEPTDIELVTGTGSVAGKELIGKFIKDGDYTLTEEDEDKLIIADNSDITAGNINVGEYKLSGNSNLKYADYTIYSTAQNFPAYPATAGAITVEILEQHYSAEGTPYYSDPDNWIWSQPYDLTVTGDMTIAGWPDLDKDGNPVIWHNWECYNDILVTSTGNIRVEEGGHFQVGHSLTVEPGGTVTGSGDHYLCIFKDDIVTGLPLYAETPDNDVSDRFSTASPGDYDFIYDSTASKWIYPFDLDAPVFRFSISGFDPDHESIAVWYKYSEAGSYTAVNPVMTSYEGDTANYGFSLKNSNNATFVCLKIEFTPATGSNKIIACWDTMSDPFNFSYDGISGDMLTLEHTFNIDPDDFVNVYLNYPDAGEPEIIDTANDYLYAYAGADEATIKTYLATELYNRFIDVPMFEDFGLFRIGALADRISELASRITVTGSLGNISATAIDGTSVTIPVNNYKVSWGNNIDNGTPVESNIPVYTLPDPVSFLICTDFDKDTGSGSTFYIRNAHADEIPFDGGGLYAIPVVVPSIDPESIVIGGMGADTTVLNSDKVFAFNLNTRWLNLNTNDPSDQNSPADYGTTVRIMIASETYVMLTGDGESKRYGSVGNNGFGTDTIWNTRTDDTAEALIYIGLSTLYLRPLAEETGIAVRGITAVEVADESLSAGVHIDDSDKGNIQLTFDSNFYATIPLNITYSDGITRKLTINRVGLVIQYQYLDGDPALDNDSSYDSVNMWLDHREETYEVKYDYFAGEQIIVYGIYYTPTNDPTGNSSDLSLYMTFEDGTHRVITAENNDTLTLGNGSKVSRGFSGKFAATNDSVATTVFLIGFAQAKNWAGEEGGNIWIGNITDTYYSDEGRIGFYANVLNAGWDDDDSFGGTQVGSGKGIYWDGHISWY